MTIKELITVVLPPEKPLEAGSDSDRPAIEEALGTALPDDYWELGKHYGTGLFCQGFLVVFNPYSKVYPKSIEAGLRSLHAHKEASDETDFPYEIFPKTPGLIPWGWDENGNNYLWLAKGKPNKWTVVLEPHGGPFEEFPMTVTTFLAKAFSNEIHSKHAWAEQTFSLEERVFEPRL